MLQIPTDSLHKFLAIFGLALTISSVSFVYKELETYRAIEGKLVKLNTELDFNEKWAKRAVDDYEKKKEHLLKKACMKQPINSTDINDLKKVVDKLRLEVGEYLNRSKENIPAINELKALKRYSVYYFFAAGMLFIIGILISAYGFHQWRLASGRRNN